MSWDERRPGGKLEIDPPSRSRPASQARETVRPVERPARTRPAESDDAAVSGQRPRPGPEAAQGGNGRPMALSILYLTSLVFGLTGLVAFILALVWKSESQGGWQASHYEYQIRTFLLWLGVMVVGIACFLTIVLIFAGFLVWFVAFIWVAVRAIVSLIRAVNSEAMPNPRSWLV